MRLLLSDRDARRKYAVPPKTLTDQRRRADVTDLTEASEREHQSTGWIVQPQRAALAIRVREVS
jgi:hypothetical protein